MDGSKLQSLKFGNGIWDPTHRFETSWLLPPWILFGIRALISLYAFVVLLYIIGTQLSDGEVGSARFSFSYFTVLCYWGLAFYFLVAAVHTFSYALHGGTPLLNRLPRPLQALHHLYFTTITTYPLLVTIVYWGVLYVPFTTTFPLWSNISEHGLNSSFALFEIIFTRVSPPPWIHLLWLVVILGLYCGLAYVTVATKHRYVYNFLDPEIGYTNSAGEKVGGVGKWVPAYVFGIAVAIIILFCVSKGLITLRKWVTERKLGLEGKFHGGRRMGQGETDLETERAWEKQPGDVALNDMR